MAGLNAYAQKTDNTDAEKGVSIISDIKPGETIFFDASKGSTGEQIRQWEDAIRAIENKRVKPYEMPVITPPDFSKMSEKEITAWEDSVLNVLYPRLEVQTSKKVTDKVSGIKEEKSSMPETRMGYVNNYVPTSVNIDKNKEVGDIAYTSSVLPNGALTYNVPIDIYPGINGFQPQVSLSYNSMGGSSVVGTGWNIGGLSSITRTSKSLYYDNYAEGVKMQKDDPFVLDGMRLIKISEVSNKICYESERGFIKVEAYTSGNNILYFKVWYPNGNVGTYGYTTNTSLSYLSYPLTQITDRFNNTISYIYDYYDNHYVIKEINYGNASVVFSYNNFRPDPIISYLGGLNVTEGRILRHIEVRHNSCTLRTYTLQHQMNKNRMSLRHIELKIGNSSYINPLTLYYGENGEYNYAYAYISTETELFLYYDFTTPTQFRTTRGKLNYETENDGIILVTDCPHYFNEQRNSTLFLHSRNRYVNEYTGNEQILFYSGLNNETANQLQCLDTEVGFIDIFCSNLDGTDEDEVIKINNTVLNNTNELLTFKVYNENNTYGLVERYVRTFQLPTVVRDADGGSSVHPKFYYSGDFDGDGKMEIFAISSNEPCGISGITSKCYIFDLESNVKRFDSYVFPFVVDFFGTFQPDPNAAKNNTDRLFIMDYDGDGKSDVCIINYYGMQVYTFDVNGSAYSMRKVADYYGINKNGLVNRELLLGDINGDGKLDMLVSPVRGQGNYWTIHYSRGNGQFETKSYNGPAYFTNSKFYTQDVNCDGLTDLLVFTESGFSTFIMAPNNSQLITYTSYGANADSSIIVPVDINNTNFFTRLVCLKGDLATKYNYPVNDTKEQLLTGLENGFGVIEKNHYRRLSEAEGSSSFYIRGWNAGYPYFDIKGPLHVPVNMEQYYNGELSGDVDISYENAIAHHQGLGFCGFSKIKTIDNIQGGRQSVQTFSPDSFGIMKSSENHLSKMTSEYSVNVQPNRITKITVSNSTMQDKATGTVKTAGYLYDTYGNPQSETINFGDNITQTTSNAYYNNATYNTGAPYIIGALTDQTVTVSRPGSSNSSRVYVSNHNYGLPLTKATYANGYKTSETTYEYNSQGLVTVVSQRPYSSSNILKDSVSYDSYGRITKKINPLGLYVKYVYNPITGLLASNENHKSQVTSYSYDNLLRRTGVIHPDGSRESTRFNWSASAGLYSITSTATGQPDAMTYYDELNRSVRSGSIRYNGDTIKTDVTYDNFGRLYRESLPFTGNDPSYWNTTSFDSYDRPATITGASGKTTTYSYSGKNVTVVSNDISVTKNFDAQGNMTSVTDPAGTITYNLRADGQPSSIVAPGNITTSFGYDAYGRQTSINDPSAGNRAFSYNATGLLETETDANNITKTMYYDQYGRVTSKVLPEFTTTYGYNPDGQFASETSTNGTSRTFQYNYYGRLYKDRDTGPENRWLEKVYSYYDGNVEAISYTSQSGYIGGEYYDYSNGHLSEIKLGATSIWQLTGENALGQPTSSLTGPITRAYGYNNYGIPTGRSANSSSDGTFQNHSYDFDIAKGNLYYRKDNKRNRQENFGYDNLNRLTSYPGITGSPVNNVVYDIKGNITEKSDVGSTFYYDTPNKPYAVSGIDAGTREAIPQRSQSVTYTSFERPSVISENGYEASFTYDGSGSRKKMQMKQNNSVIYSRYYLGDRYELDVSSSNKQKLYLGGDAYSAPAVYVNTGSSWVLYYICRDYLGSITHLVNSTGTVAHEYSYDAWGRLRNPSTHAVYTPGSEPALMLDRGYTGHEHLPEFGLINMNARLYDPAVGRFLSPDPYVQSPDFSQNLNRYSYALNNPLIYSDPSGEKWWHWLLGGLALFDPLSAITTGLAASGTASVSALTTASVAAGTSLTMIGSANITAAGFSSALSGVDFGVTYFGTLFKGDPAWGGKRIENWAKLEWGRLNAIGGTFRYDKSARGIEWPMQVINNLSGGEFLQDNIGNGFGHLQNIGGHIDKIGYYQGRTIIRLNENYIGQNWFSGISFGHNVFGRGIALNPNDNSQGKDGLDLFAHEFGHTYQSRITGHLYLFKYGIPSAAGGDLSEVDANRRGVYNLGYDNGWPQGKNRIRFWEWGIGNMLWTHMWLWNR